MDNDDDDDDDDDADAAAIGVDLGGSPAHAPPIIENCPCIYHFLPPFAPQYFGLPTQYF